MILSSPGSVGAGAGFDISEPMKDDLPFFGRLILKSSHLLMLGMPFFIRFPWSTLPWSSTLSPSMPSMMW
jgi:hypothetical protein